MINLALSELGFTVDVSTHDSGHLLNSFHGVNVVGLILFGINIPVGSFLVHDYFYVLDNFLISTVPHSVSGMLYP